ncbi:MAG TPA: hypothetical protein VGR02_22125 [Thermoanaerobaculia bacterium]|jgi:hypothetical protein|nr:hypothetical protein [Thermoanaerobaculia bacterium]
MIAHDVVVGVASAAELRWIAQLEVEHYGNEQAAALYRLQMWHAANPNGFLVIRDGAELVGHATMLPLKPPILRALIDGSKGEKDIERDDIFPPGERGAVRNLYIESLIVQPIQLFGAFILSFHRHIARVAVPRHIDALYAYPITAAGRLVIANLQFQQVGPSLHAAKYASLAKKTASLRARMAIDERLAGERRTENGPGCSCPLLAARCPLHQGLADFNFTANLCGS